MWLRSFLWHVLHGQSQPQSSSQCLRTTFLGVLKHLVPHVVPGAAQTTGGYATANKPRDHGMHPFALDGRRHGLAGLKQRSDMSRYKLGYIGADGQIFQGPQCTYTVFD